MMMNLYRLNTTYRRVLPLAVALVLAGCASSGSEQSAPDQGTVVEAQRIAEQAAAARAAQERARIAAAAAAEAERVRQAAAAQQQAEQRAQAEAAAQAEREAAARAQAAAEQRQRQEEAAQQARIAELEAEIAAARANTGTIATANARLEEAIATAEELLEVLNAEQLKYGNTNAAGEPVEPLQKDRIADLEARKNTLKLEAQALSQQ